jgi:malonyl-coA-[acyl-carrier-protein] transacylase
VDVKAETESAEIRTALIRQLYSPVRWTETVEKMAQDGVEVLVEIGPGKVLNGLTKRIVAELQATSVNDVTSLDAVEALLA